MVIRRSLLLSSQVSLYELRSKRETYSVCQERMNTFKENMIACFSQRIQLIVLDYENRHSFIILKSYFLKIYVRKCYFLIKGYINITR